MSTLSVVGLPFLIALEMIAILGYMGIHVLKREVIFIDIALAQVAAAGAIAAHLAFGAHSDSAAGYACAFAGTLVAAGFFSLTRRRVVQIPLEAIIGVTYAIAAALALFLVGVAPGGHVHIQQMLAGSILWATPRDVIVCGVVFAAVGLCFFAFRKPLGKISDDYEGSVREGMNTVAWDFLFYALFGIVITLAVRIAGVVVVFAFLIIPATLSAIFAKGWGARVVITWISGAVAAGLGLLFADRFDFSVGPAIALFLGLGLICSALLRQIRVPKAATAVGSLSAAVVLLVWFASLSGSSSSADVNPQAQPGRSPDTLAWNGADAGEAAKTPAHHAGHHAAHHETSAGETPEVDPARVARIEDPGELVRIFDGASDMEIRTAAVIRLLDVEPREGARLALEFLRDDPPFLFRRGVVDKLYDVSGQTVKYDIEEPFGSTANQRAAAAIATPYGLEP